ncbi:MAG: serine/threonine protein kinase [Deltaproteobacteria bacterium]|nr:MAG: serine/threonine protein kinase [Deltaproteobacteria bacterium]
MADTSDDKDAVPETLVPSLKLSVHALATTGARGVNPAEIAARAAAAAASPTTPARKLRGARVGDVVGDRYVVEGTLGRGGMGRVLRVRHQALGKAFALKLIKVPIANSPRIREMFYREARLASALSHLNICSVVDFGEDDEFGLFMVMELLEGKTLFKKIEHDGRLAPRVACDVIWQVADALRYIHGRAIIHGDIKSENMLLTRAPDRRRVVKLLDFGLARAEAALRGAGGRVEGTPHYLAPERIHGDPPSQQSDIYALGILFYEVLVGRLPFTGSVEDIFRAHLDEPVPRPSTQIDEPLDERADEIVARATAKDPADRHPDVASFLYELRTLMNMLGIDTGRRRPSREPRATGPAPLKDERADAAAVETFEFAPVPLACVTPEGRVRVANRAFLEFLGVAGQAGGIDLSDSALCDVYPAFLDDLRRTATRRTPTKRVIYLSEGADRVVEVAVIMTSPSPSEASVTGGEVHVAFHPLARTP